MAVARQDVMASEDHLVRFGVLEPIQQVSHRIGQVVGHPGFMRVVDDAQGPYRYGHQRDPAHAQDDAGEGELDHSLTLTP